MRKKTIPEKIAATAKAINHQISDYGDAVRLRAINVWIDDTGKIITVKDPMDLQARVETSKRILDNMLRHLDELIKKRDGIAATIEQCKAAEDE